MIYCNLTSTDFQSGVSCFHVIVYYYCLPILFAVGIPSNIVCLIGLFNKVKESSGYVFQILVVINDTLLLLTNIFRFYCSSASSLDIYPPPWKSYAVAWLCVYVFLNLQNVFFGSSPQLMLMVTIERNIAVFAPFMYREANMRCWKIFFICLVYFYNTVCIFGNLRLYDNAIVPCSNITVPPVPDSNSTKVTYCMENKTSPSFPIFDNYIFHMINFANDVLLFIILLAIIVLNMY